MIDTQNRLAIDGINWIGSPGREKTPTYAIRVFRAGSTAKSDRVDFALSQKMADTLRWVPGDRVQMAVHAGHLYIRRVTQDGWKMVAPGKGPGLRVTVGADIFPLGIDRGGSKAWKDDEVDTDGVTVRVAL